jgi:hypothetical protein
VTGRLGHSQDDVRELAETFVESLSESSRLAEAAIIAAEYLEDGDSAVALLSQVFKSTSRNLKASGASVATRFWNDCQPT